MFFYVPGEHDVLNDDGNSFRAYGKQQGRGVQLHKKGLHFVGLVN